MISIENPFDNDLSNSQQSQLSTSYSSPAHIYGNRWDQWIDSKALGIINTHSPAVFLCGFVFFCVVGRRRCHLWQIGLTNLRLPVLLWSDYRPEWACPSCAENPRVHNKSDASNLEKYENPD